MSAPGHRIRHAEHISYGLLAVNSADVITKLLQSKSLSQRDYDALSQAAEFISNIADGADLVTRANYNGHSSTASMKALDVAIGPLEQLQGLAQDQKAIADTLRTIANKLSAIATSKQTFTTKDRPTFERLNVFFERLNNSLMKEMMRGRQRLSAPSLSRKTHRNSLITN